MKIDQIRISNFRSLKEFTVEPGKIFGLVGRNNSGKSNVLHALRLFFEPSVSLVGEECFYNHDTEQPIDIVVKFGELGSWEVDRFKAWMDGDNLIVGRRISCSGSGKYNIVTFAYVRESELEFLKQDSITGKKIDEWWAEKSTLKVGHLDFAALFDKSKPKVGEWKIAAERFVMEHGESIPTAVNQIENPTGYGKALKDALPEFVYVPAVRDVTDEAKVSKTNPFGRLIHTMLDQVADAQKEALAEQIHAIERSLNRGTDDRFDEISHIEKRLNELLRDLIDCDIEIEMSLPKLETVIGGAKIYADDGIRTAIESKGHGLQRTMIFTILRAYAELSHGIKAGEMDNERSTIFAIEEPEIYLHPQYQRTLMGLFRKIASGTDQVFYTTQSSLFVDIEHFDEICIVRRDGKGDEKYTQPKQLSIKVLIDDLQNRKGIRATENGIREQYAHVFSPVVNEGFFADKVIIVEGASEVYSIPEYAHALDWDLDRENISVIPAGGKGPIDRLLRIFTGFGIPVYIVFDGDKTNNDKEIKAKTLEILKMLDSPRDSIEEVNTEVSDYYTVFEETYDKFLQAEIPEYAKLAANASKALGPTGKPLQNKYIAKTIRENIEKGDSEGYEVPQLIKEMLDNVKRLDSAVDVLQA